MNEDCYMYNVYPRVCSHSLNLLLHTCTLWESHGCTAKTDFLEQISNANLRFFIHPNFAFLSGPNKVDLRGISKLIEVK